jgi:hypothetical protein
MPKCLEKATRFIVERKIKSEPLKKAEGKKERNIPMSSGFSFFLEILREPEKTLLKNRIAVTVIIIKDSSSKPSQLVIDGFSRGYIHRPRTSRRFTKETI